MIPENIGVFVVSSGQGLLHTRLRAVRPSDYRFASARLANSNAILLFIYSFPGNWPTYNSQYWEISQLETFRAHSPGHVTTPKPCATAL